MYSKNINMLLKSKSFMILMLIIAIILLIGICKFGQLIKQYDNIFVAGIILLIFYTVYIYYVEFFVENFDATTPTPVTTTPVMTTTPVTTTPVTTIPVTTIPVTTTSVTPAITTTPTTSIIQPAVTNNCTGTVSNCINTNVRLVCTIQDPSTKVTSSYYLTSYPFTACSPTVSTGDCGSGMIPKNGILALVSRTTMKQNYNAFLTSNPNSNSTAARYYHDFVIKNMPSACPAGTATCAQRYKMDGVTVPNALGKSGDVYVSSIYFNKHLQDPKYTYASSETDTIKKNQLCGFMTPLIKNPDFSSIGLYFNQVNITPTTTTTSVSANNIGYQLSYNLVGKNSQPMTFYVGFCNDFTCTAEGVTDKRLCLYDSASNPNVITFQIVASPVDNSQP